MIPWGYQALTPCSFALTFSILRFLEDPPYLKNAKAGKSDSFGVAFLMTCPRTAAHEETELLTVLKIPFRVRTP